MEAEQALELEKTKLVEEDNQAEKHKQLIEIKKAQVNAQAEQDAVVKAE